MSVKRFRVFWLQNYVKSVVVACLMRFCSCFGRFFLWSFSMLLEVSSLWFSEVGYGVLKMVKVDGVDSLE